MLEEAGLKYEAIEVDFDKANDPNIALTRKMNPLGTLPVLVLEGGFSEGGETFAPQSWLRLPMGMHLRAQAAVDGYRAWIREGHLRHIQPVQPEPATVG